MIFDEVDSNEKIIRNTPVEVDIVIVILKILIKKCSQQIANAFEKIVIYLYYLNREVMF